MVVAFLGGNPPSARGLYYVVWLSFFAALWKKRGVFESQLQKSPLGTGVTFIGLGLLMIFIEETFTGIFVNILLVSDFFSLVQSIPQYYANNFLLLPGFIVAWYVLLRRYAYTRTEVFVLVGIFGLFAERIYLHVVTIPIMGIPLILPTMFTYMGIIAPSLLSLKVTGLRRHPMLLRYTIGILFPVLVSIPFVFLHGVLTEAGIVDSTVLFK